MQAFDTSKIFNVRPLNADQVAKLNTKIIAKAKTMLELIADLHGVSLGDGINLSVIRNTETNLLMSVHITPVDATGDGQGVPRYDSCSAKVTEG